MTKEEADLRTMAAMIGASAESYWIETDAVTGQSRRVSMPDVWYAYVDDEGPVRHPAYKTASFERETDALAFACEAAAHWHPEREPIIRKYLDAWRATK